MKRSVSSPGKIMMSTGFLKRATRLLAVVVLASASLWAQLNRGVIEGTITDPQGAAVPGVSVTVVDVETAISQALKTNDAGYYRAEGLVPGPYRIEVVGRGFERLEISRVVVIAAQVLREDATLKLGESRQSVQVLGTPPLVETSASNWSASLSPAIIENLPLQGRDLQNLVNLLPGVNNVAGPPGTLFGFNSAYGTFPDLTHSLGSQVSVSGGQAGANAWYLDGNLDLSALAQNMAVDPSPDSVSEFQGVTNSFGAQYGYTGGGVFNVVLKSGTNQIHGDIYEFNQNSAFNARNPFTSINSLGQIIPQAQIRYNEFGGTVGGPVYIPHVYNGKDRTFFFFSDDATILHTSNSNAYTVPTPLMRQGNFSEDPNVLAFGMWNPYSTVGPNSQTGLFDRVAFGTPVPGNPYGALGCYASAVASGASTCNFSTQIPANMFNPYAMFFVNSFPQPNYNDPLATCLMSATGPYKICNNYLATVGSSQDAQNISLKIDEKWSDKSTFFGEWLFNPGKYNNYRLPWTGPTFPMSSLHTNSPYPISFANTIIAFGNTYTFSPTTLNEFRLNFTRQFLNTNPRQPYPNSVNDQSGVVQDLAPLGIPGLNPFYPTPVFPISTPEGSVNFGPTSWVNSTQSDQGFNLADNVTKIMGKHTVKAGLMYVHSHTVFDVGFPVLIGFGGDLVSNPITAQGASGLAQFMMGAISNNGSFYTGRWQSDSETFPYWGMYGQDDYRVTPSLTLNVGLRYDLFYPFSVNNYPASNFCFHCLNSQTGLPGEFVYQGGPDWTGNGSRMGSPNTHDFGPRFNFAWSPFKNQRTVLRGGYDVLYSNAYEGLASPGEGGSNLPGWFTVFSASASYDSSQCAPFVGECVLFPFAPTAVSKASVVNFTNTFPAQARSQQYVFGAQPITPPNKDPMVQIWNIEIEQKLPGNTALSVRYVGNHGTHLLADWYRYYDFLPINVIRQYKTQLNVAVPITSIYSGKTAALLQNVYGSPDLPPSILKLPYPFWNTGLFTVADSFDGTSIYHALQVTVQKQFSHGLNFIATYTASKDIANASLGGLQVGVTTPNNAADSIGGRAGAQVGTISGDRYQNPLDRKADRSVAPYDLPQIFNFAATYQLPFGRGRKWVNQRGVLNALVGGWAVTPNLNAESGFPLGITCPGDQVTSRCDLVGNPRAVPGGQNAAHWINPGAFLPPFGPDTNNFWANYDPNADRAYNYGTAGPVLPQIRAPGFWNLDASLMKEFHISESKYFEFRWDVFNSLNHQNLALPSTYFCLPPLPDGTVDLVHQAGCAFGLITNIQTDPRTMHFALKFHW